MLCCQALPVVQLLCYAAAAGEALRPYQKLSTFFSTDNSVDVALRGGEPGYFEKCLAEWPNRRAYEKLAVAERLREWLGISRDVPVKQDGEEMLPREDLSVIAGRARRLLEVLFGTKLSGCGDRNPSPEQIERISEQASVTVEAYRQGIMALAADHEVPPDQFERLKRKYKHKIEVGLSKAGAGDGIDQMHDLLGDWPPIGRRYEDLVSIIGAKGENRDSGVVYAFDFAGGNECMFCLTVRDGIIRSVRVRIRE